MSCMTLQPEVFISSEQLRSQDYPVGQLFWLFSKFQTPGTGVAPRPNMGTENWNFLKLLKTIIVGLYGFVWVSCVLGYFFVC